MLVVYLPGDGQRLPETAQGVAASVQGQVGQWSPATSGLPSIYGCSGALACFGSRAPLPGDGDVLVAGGDAGLASNSHSSAEAVLYNPITNSWTTTGSLNNSRLFQTASLLQNGQVLVAGGESFANHAPTRLVSAELYTPSGPLARDESPPFVRGNQFFLSERRGHLPRAPAGSRCTVPFHGRPGS